MTSTFSSRGAGRTDSSSSGMGCNGAASQLVALLSLSTQAECTHRSVDHDAVRVLRSIALLSRNSEAVLEPVSDARRRKEDEIIKQISLKLLALALALVSVALDEHALLQQATRAKEPRWRSQVEPDRLVVWEDQVVREEA